MVYKNKYRIITVITSILIAYLLAATIFQVYFAQKDNVVTITALAKRNENSLGTDCRIKNISLNQEPVSVSELNLNGNWETDDNGISLINPDQMSYLTFFIANKNKLTIEFVMQQGSGIVEIRCNDKIVDLIDLYSQEWKTFVWEKQIPLYYSVFSNIPLFTVLLLCSLAVLSFFSYTLKRFRQAKKELRILLYKVSILTVFLTAIYMIVVNNKQWTILYMLEYSTIVWLILWVISVNLFIGGYEKLGEEDSLHIIHIFVLWISPIISFIIVEAITDKAIIRMELKYQIGNLLIYYAIHFCFYITLRRIKPVLFLSSFVVYIFAMVNYFVTQFRGSPITPGDFLILKTAVSVSSNYYYEISSGICLATIILIIWLLIPWLFGKFRNYKCNSSHMIFYYIMEILLLFFITKTSLFNISLDLWNLNNNIDNYGVAYSFIASLRQMVIEEPSGYSEEIVSQLYDENKLSDYESSEYYPDIIVIMNEALSDLRVINSFNISEEIFPFIYSLEDNTVRGNALVSSLGGGTANTEYEFLTGNTMAFFPKGSLPYQQYINKKQTSLASFLLKIGYKTIAIHPYYADGYNRAKNYPLLGFEAFYDITSFHSPDLTRGRYISDMESFKKIIDIYENQENDVPLFFFNVTMQNHSDYNTGYYKNDAIKLSDYPGKYPEVEEYLSLMKESDKAFKNLVSYFKKVEHPVIILMFGDHQPNLKDEFYEDLYQSNLNELSLEEIQRRYTVPFIIWANFDIPEQYRQLTSVNYLSTILLEKAGIQGTPYNNFLLHLSNSIPAMNANGFWGNDQIWHTYDEKDEYATQLLQYQYLQYNNVFSKNSLPLYNDAK